MRFNIPVLATLIAAAGSAIASPITEKATVPPSRYYLQTKVVGDNTDCGTNKDGLWMYSYHTGAGLGDTGLSSNKSIAWAGYLNGTKQMFKPTGSPYSWTFAVGYGAYQQWVPTTISAAGSQGYKEGFYFTASGLQYNQSNNGWLACDWWHGVPQLFSLAQYTYGPIAHACSKVELHPIAA